MAQDNGLVASECGLERVCMEHDAKCDRVEAVQQDYRDRIHAFTAGCRRSFNFDRILQERRILLSL
jgi:hypothetical protein